MAKVARTLGSLFSGIGGLDLGLSQAGWWPLWRVEQDPYRQAVLRHHGEAKVYGDVKEINTDELYRVDLIVEPGMGRVADGLPNRVERLAALGDAVCPPVARWLGERIREAA